MATVDQQITDLTSKIKEQEKQIQNLKTAVAKLQKYVSQIERKSARAGEQTRINTETLNKVVRTLRDMDG